MKPLIFLFFLQSPLLCSQVIGLSSAYQLALRGVEVTVLEEKESTGQATILR